MHIVHVHTHGRTYMSSLVSRTLRVACEWGETALDTDSDILILLLTHCNITTENTKILISVRIYDTVHVPIYTHTGSVDAYHAYMYVL